MAIKFVVYEPPVTGAPFLAVTYDDDMRVTAKAFPDAAGAEAYKNEHALWTHEQLRAIDNA